VGPSLQPRSAHPTAAPAARNTPAWKSAIPHVIVGSMISKPRTRMTGCADAGAE
jgi:hypothetical protein